MTFTALPLAAFLALAAPAAPAKPADNPWAAELHGSWPAKASGKKVTVEAKSPNDALKQVAAAAGWGLALNTGTAGEAKIEFSFKKVGVEEAFAAVLSASQLQANRVGDSISVTRKHGEPAEAAGEAAEEAKDEAEDQADAAQEAAEKEAADYVAGALADAGVLPDGGTGFTINLGKHHKHKIHKNGNDKVEIGQNIDIPAGAKVGDVVAVDGSIHIGSGATTDDVVSIFGTIEADPGAQIGGNAVAVGGSTHLGSGAHVKGDTVTLGGVLDLDPGAQVDGQQVTMGAGKLFSWGVPAAFAGGLTVLFLVSKLAQFVLFFCLGALLILAAPSQLTNIENALMRNPVRAGLAGFLATLAAPVLGLLLVVTIVGIPLVAVELFGLALALLMGFTALSIFIGRRLKIPIRGGGLLGLAVGVAVVLAVTSLPWVGHLVLITAWFAALGAALVTRFGSVAQG